MVRMPHWPIPLWFKPIDLGLERIAKLLTALGNPERHMPPVIHVTGTNGKGSTIAFMRAILEAAGYKVHCYTSPHLVRFNERIRLAGQEISDHFLKGILEETRMAAESIDVKVTFFEGTTAAAFLAFSRVQADIALVEVGLGGRLDATNVFQNPLATVITTISLDHMDLLGDTLQKIAYEKAGIMRPNIPCILSQQLPEVENFYIKCAEMRNVPLIAYEYDFVVDREQEDVYFLSRSKKIKLPKPSLPGEHQFINAASAIATLTHLENISISERDIAKGISTAYWPGRLHLLETGRLTSFLPSDFEIWLDGAHNEAGAQALSLWLEAHQDKPVFLVLGMTKGRNVEKFLKYFLGKTQLVYGVLIENEQSAYNAEYIVDAAQRVGIEAKSCASIEDTLKDIGNHSNLPGRVIVCGSLYLVGEFLDKNSINSKLNSNSINMRS